MEEKYYPLKKEDYNGIMKFLKRISVQKHEYKVAVSSRCFNLCSYFNYEEGINGLDKDIISPNALLLYAEQFADYYHANGEFPNILLFNDTFFSGSTMSTVLYTLEELVYNYLNKKYPDDKIGKYNVHRNLVSAIDIYVYAMNVNLNIIEHSYLYKLNSSVKIYQDELNFLLQNISVFLTNVNCDKMVVNNFFSLSMKKDDSLNLLQVKNWNHTTWNGDYYTRFIENDNLNLSQTIENNQRWLTSVTILNNMSIENFNELCNLIINYLSTLNSTKYSRLISILQSNEYYQIDQKSQLVSFFLSLIGMYDFIKSINSNLDKEEWKKMIYEKSNIDKISTNFAKYSEINEVLYAICIDEDFIKLLKSRVFNENISNSYQETISNVSKYNIRVNTEFFLSQKRMEFKINTYRYSHNFKVYAPLNIDCNLLSLNSWRYKMEKIAKTNAKSNLNAYALSLAKQGYITFSYQPLHQNVENLSTTIKINELSTCLIPLHFIVFLPAILLVEQRCWRINQPPYEAMKQFIKWLEKNIYIFTDDKQLIQELVDIYPAYIDASREMKMSQISLSCLVYDKEIVSEEDKEIRKKQKVYWEEARKFLHL